ncbi:MAG: hypothetical protein WC285_05600, partial [Candidatus Gracilibacteria bacterium]
SKPTTPDDPKAKAPVPTLVQPASAPEPSPETEPSAEPVPRDSKFSEFDATDVCESVQVALSGTSDDYVPPCLVGDRAVSAALTADCSPDDKGAQEARVEAGRIAGECREGDEDERLQVACADAVDKLILESAEVDGCGKIAKLRIKVAEAIRACLKAAKNGSQEAALRRLYGIGKMHWLPSWATRPDISSSRKREAIDPSGVPDCLKKGLNAL